MALDIKVIPTLRGEEARNFENAANKAYQHKHTIDYSKQVSIARKILKKANML